MSGSCDWGQFLNLARVLSEQGHSGPPPDPESKKRTAINRSYYAAMHLANAHIREEEPGAELSEHGDTWRWFKCKQDKTLKQIGADIDRLYSLRRKADYSDSFERLDDNAWTSILLAEKVISDISAAERRGSKR